MARKPLSGAETIEQIAKLDSKADRLTLRKLIERVERGDAYEEDVRRLLIKFCRGARKVRRQFPLSTVPLLIDFVARRITLFLIGKEPDLMRAFGLKRPTRGRKPKSKTERRAVFIAAKVREVMDAGKTFDEAVEIVAQEARIHESTVREYHAKHTEKAEMILLYRDLLAPGALDTEDETRSP